MKTLFVLCFAAVAGMASSQDSVVCASRRCVQTSAGPRQPAVSSPAAAAQRQQSGQVPQAAGACGAYAVDSSGRCVRVFHLPRLAVQNVQGGLTDDQWRAGLGGGWKTGVRFTNSALNPVQVDVLYRDDKGAAPLLLIMDNIYPDLLAASEVYYPTNPGNSWEVRALSASDASGNPTAGDVTGIIDVRYNAATAADLDAQTAPQEELWFEHAYTTSEGNPAFSPSWLSVVGKADVPDGTPGKWTLRFGVMPQAGNPEGEVVAMSLANPLSTAVTVRVTLRLADGAIKAQKDETIPATSSVAYLFSDYFPGAFPGGVLSVGSVEIAPTAPTSAVIPFFIKVKGDGGTALPIVVTP